VRQIKAVGLFKKDFKREARSSNAEILVELLPVLVALATDQPLDSKYRDHPLGGGKKDLRDCHVRPDLVLLYSNEEEGILWLVRLGSHSELGL
jgi:mRNA interferase YafQ